MFTPGKSLRRGIQPTSVLVVVFSMVLASRTAQAQFFPPIVDVPAGEIAPGAWPFTVTAANVNIAPVAGSVLGGANSDNLSVSFPNYGPIKWTGSRFNEGDFSFNVGPGDTSSASDPPAPADNYSVNTGPTADAWRLNHTAGYAAATVRVNGRDNGDTFGGGSPVGTVYGTANFSAGFSSGVGYNMIAGTFQSGGGSLDLVAGIAGAVDEGSFDVAASFFPYGQGWIGGFVNASGIDPLTGAGVAWHGDLGRRSASPKLDAFTPPVTWVANGSGQFTDGRATVDLGAGKSPTNGMLFVSSVDDDSNLDVAAAVPNVAGGWNVTVRANSDFDTSGATLSPTAGGDANFGFLYVDYNSPNLIGGRITGSTGSAVAGQTAGAYTLTRTAAGTYELVVPGKTGSDGTLLLSTASGDSAAGGLAGRQFLSYEYTGGKFVIQSRASVGGGPAPTNGTFPLTDSDFYFAFVDFNNPMTPIEESFQWNAFSDSYSNFSAWTNPGRPVYVDDVTIGNGGTAYIDGSVSGSDAAMARTMSIGTAGGSGTVEVFADGELFIANRLYVGDTGDGTLNQSGGRIAVEKQGEEDLHIGNEQGSVGVYTMTGGELSIGDDFLIGHNGTGTFNLDGGTVLRAGFTVLGDSNAVDAGGVEAHGTLNMTAGSFTLAFGDMEVGDEGVGVANLSGGTLTVPGRFSIGNRALGTGTANISGTISLTSEDLSVGHLGNGTLQVTGGTATINPTRDFLVTPNAGATGKLISEITDTGLTPIHANRDVAIGANSTYEVIATSLPATGAHLWDVVVADSDHDSVGTLTGDFTTKIIPAVADALDRKLRYLIEGEDNRIVLGFSHDGDVNFDGVVNIFDINLVSAGWNTTNDRPDANGDNIVNIFDINLISSNWGNDVGSATPVPEPQSLALLAAGLLVGLPGIVRARRRRVERSRSARLAAPVEA
jgi:T5SS/PEP-CTERM-associated repeat protein